MRVFEDLYHTQFHDPTLTDAKAAIMSQVRKQILLLLLMARNQKYVLRVTCQWCNSHDDFYERRPNGLAAESAENMAIA